MMMKYLSLLLLLFVCLATGCDDDDSFAEPQPELFQTGSECARSCNGVGECDELNFCRCPEGGLSIAPGFCVQRPERVIFVSYDTIPGLIDTLILELVDEPFDLPDWVEGESAFKSMPGKTYARDPYAATIGGTTQPITYVWTGPETRHPTDSVWISGVYDQSSRWAATTGVDVKYHYNEDWLCGFAQFGGKFTDENTITGNIMVGFCRTSADNPQPDSLPHTLYFPMTWHRLER